MPFDYERFRERLFPALLAGDRRQARLVAANAREQGAKAEELVTQGYFPLLKELAALYRSDRVSMLAHHYATRILHNLLESSQLEFSVQEPNQRRILIFSGSASLEELQGLIAADILEAAGWDVRFGGGATQGSSSAPTAIQDRVKICMILGRSCLKSPRRCPLGCRHDASLLHRGFSPDFGRRSVFYRRALRRVEEGGARSVCDRW